MPMLWHIKWVPCDLANFDFKKYNFIAKTDSILTFMFINQPKSAKKSQMYKINLRC